MPMAHFPPQSVSICRGDSTRIIMTNHNEVVRIHRHIRVPILTFRRIRINFIFNLNLALEIQNNQYQRFLNKYYVGILCLCFHLLLLMDFKTEIRKAYFCPQFVFICTGSIWLFIRIRTSKTTAISLRTTKYLLVDDKYNQCEDDILVNQFDQQVCTICTISSLPKVLLTIAMVLRSTRQLGSPPSYKRSMTPSSPLILHLFGAFRRQVTQRVISLMTTHFFTLS